MSDIQFVEPLTQGLVTSRDPAQLKSGELTQAKNCVYLPYDEALHRAFGRLDISTVSTATGGVTGLRALQFDGDVVRLLAQANTSGGSPATWSVNGATATQIETLTASGAHLETAQFRGRYFVFNGTNVNRVYVASGANIGGRLTTNAASFYEHGLKPVSTQIASATGTGTWSLTATGLYEYWTTEVVRFATGGVVGDLESTFNGNPLTINVTATNAPPIIYRPSPVNTAATHWNLYRSPLKEFLNDTSFPSGDLIAANIDIDTQSVTDGTTAQTVALTLPSSNGGNSNYNDWSTPANAMNDADANLIASANNGVGGLFNRRQMYYGFAGFNAVRGKVTGITMTIRARYTGTGAPHPVLTAMLGVRDSSTGLFYAWPPATPYVAGFNPNPVAIPTPVAFRGLAFPTVTISKRTAPLTTTLAVYTLGSAIDDWLPPGINWTDTDLANLGVIIQAGFFASSGAQVVEVEYLKIRVDYSGLNPSEELRPFRAITVVVGNQETAVGTDGLPPVSSTGDIFEGSLVVDDVGAPGKIKWSYPGYPESFPEGLYELELPGATRDVVTCIKTVGRAIVVGMRNSLWRISYLPSEEDSNFQRGRAVDVIDIGHGIVNPMAAALFTGPDGRTELAFAAYDGLYATDGFTVRLLSADLDWINPTSTETTISKYDSIQIVNNPTLKELVMYYQSSATLTDTLGSDLALHFNYGLQHIKSGQERGLPKISGPVRVSNLVAGNTDYVRAVAVQPTTANASLVWAGYGGINGAHIWQDGYYQTPTYVIPHTNDSLSVFASRRMYNPKGGPGISHEWTLDDVHLYNGTPGAASTHTVTPINILTNGIEVVGTAISMSTNTVLSQAQVPLNVEGVKLRFSETAGANVPNAWLFAVVKGTNFQDQDSG